jgi:hypothetical protein
MMSGTLRMIVARSPGRQPSELTVRIRRIRFPHVYPVAACRSTMSPIAIER